MNYQCLSNDKWREMWIRQAEYNDVSELPAMVPLDIQSRLHGTSGVAAITGALKFRDVVLGNIDPIPRRSTLLDFGCGWGRHIRVFLKDFDRDKIFAVDIDQANIDYINELLPGINPILCKENVQLSIESSSIDLIISFSVFSHINEDSARYWLGELSRVLKPSGVAIITSWGRSLFDIFEKIKTTGKFDYAWEKNIDLAFSDKDAVKKMYECGQYVFGRHGNPGPHLDPNLYGISLMPYQWIENNTDFIVKKVIDNPKIVPQTTFILKRSV